LLENISILNIGCSFNKNHK